LESLTKITEAKEKIQIEAGEFVMITFNPFKHDITSEQLWCRDRESAIRNILSLNTISKGRSILQISSKFIVDQSDIEAKIFSFQNNNIEQTIVKSENASEPKKDKDKAPKYSYSNLVKTDNQEFNKNSTISPLHFNSKKMFDNHLKD